MKTVTLVFCYGARTTKGKSSSPESFIDVSYLKELEQGGFIKKLYGE